jgi:hypothetical protein
MESSIAFMGHTVKVVVWVVLEDAAFHPAVLFDELAN